MFSSLLQWIISFETNSRYIIHYLDEFLFVVPGSGAQWQFLLDTFQFHMTKLGVPLTAEQMGGPSFCRFGV